MKLDKLGGLNFSVGCGLTVGTCTVDPLLLEFPPPPTDGSCTKYVRMSEPNVASMLVSVVVAIVSTLFV